MSSIAQPIHLHHSSHYKAWLYLLLAIITEVAGTSFMADSVRQDGLAGYLVMAVALPASYYFLSRAIQTLSVGIAYAVWEGLGLVGLTMVGIYWFDQQLVPQEWIGLALALVGIICITLGEES